MPKKVNAFAKYLFELKGLRPDLSMSEAQQLAGKNWEKMDANEREKYKSGSKRDNEKFEDTRVRYNCLGQSIEEVNRQEREKRAKEERMVKHIEQTIDCAIENDKLLDEVFYLFSASYYIKKSNDSIFPAEIAIAKFSLRDGITDVYQTFINPGILPMGMAATALQHSNLTHRLPLPPNKLGESNYHKILDDILSFLEAKELSSTCVPPFYVFSNFDGDDFEAAQMTLEKIAFENKCNNGFVVLRAEQLLFSLNQRIVPNSNQENKIELRSLIQSCDVMRRDNFRYITKGCEFHYNQDISHVCALSKIKRWGYSIVEYCGLDCLELVPNQHYAISNTIVIEDFDDENDESCLTESFHQMTVTESECTDTRSILSESRGVSGFSSQLDFIRQSSNQFFMPMRSMTSLRTEGTKSFDSLATDSQIDLSRKNTIDFCDSDSNTTFEDSIKYDEQSFVKKLLKYHKDSN